MIARATTPKPATTRDLARREMARRVLARRKMLHFTKYTFPEYRVNWHHVLLCKALDMLLRREIVNLFVFMSPQHGKSELVSRRFPAMVFGHYPDSRMMLSSYASKLATEMATDTKRIIKSDEYQRLFTGRAIGDIDQADRFNIADHRGKYVCGGIQSGLTGFGYDFGILDDLLKNAEEARSETIREKVIDELQKTFLTRRSPQYRLLTTATRWHEEDGPGWLMRYFNDAGVPFHVLVFQAEKTMGTGVIHELSQMEHATLLFQDEDPRELGEFIWEDYYGKEYYELEKNSVAWTALHQQSPTAEDGNIFNRSWFRYYHREGDMISVDGSLVDPMSHQRFMTVDLAYTEKTSSDYSVLATWVFNGKDLFLVDLIRERMDPADCMDLIVTKCKQNRVGRCYVEDNGTQKGYVSILQRRGAPVVGINPKREDKTARAYAQATWFQQGRVWFPATAPWLADLEHELLVFDNGAHDDQVDAIVYGVREAFGGSQGVRMVDVQSSRRHDVFENGVIRGGVFG